MYIYIHVCTYINASVKRRVLLLFNCAAMPSLPDASWSDQRHYPRQTPDCQPVCRLKAGEVVDVFRRAGSPRNPYFMVPNVTAGTHFPLIGLTDGWTQGVVTKDWEVWSYDAFDPGSWVNIEWSHPLWFDRCAKRMNKSQPGASTAFVPPDLVRRRLNEPSEAQQQPVLTLLHVRFGGPQPVGDLGTCKGPLYDMDGGAASESYINGWEDRVFRQFGPTYEVPSSTGCLQWPQASLKS
jgi:hypothetical protein